MQEAIDIHLGTAQTLTIEKGDFETRYKAELRKAEDVGFPTTV
jgi:hypothetical protein